MNSKEDQSKKIKGQSKEVDYEELIIKEILESMNRERQMDLLSWLGARFRNEKWRNILVLINEIVVEGGIADSVSLYTKGKARGIIDAVEASKLSQGISSDANAEYHIKILKELNYHKDVIEIVQKNTKGLENAVGYDETEEFKNKIIADLNGLSIDDISKFINFDELTDKMLYNIQKNERDIEGFSWGLMELDTFTNGILIPRMIIVGGLKKGGKSRFMIQLIKHLCDQQVKQAMLQLEMPGYELVKLVHSNVTQIPDHKLRSHNFLSNEEISFIKHADILKQYFDIECVSGINKDAVLSRVRRYAKMGYKVIYIDFLQRIRHNRLNQAQELEQISNDIADATRDNNITVILLAQLSNLAERELPTIGHLKGSGGIGESGDIILLLDNIYRRTKKEADKGKMDIDIEQKYGDSGVVHVMIDLATCSYKNYTEDKYEVADNRYEKEEPF